MVVSSGLTVPNFTRAFITRVESVIEDDQVFYYSIINEETGRSVGVSSYTFAHPESGSIGIGHLNFSPLMQRTWVRSLFQKV